jgi:hypothetical protein
VSPIGEAPEHFDMAADLQVGGGIARVPAAG